jgi:hypothetical protein
VIRNPASARGASTQGSTLSTPKSPPSERPGGTATGDASHRMRSGGSSMARADVSTLGSAVHADGETRDGQADNSRVGCSEAK